MKNALKLALNANRALAGDPPTGFSLSDSSHPENAALGEVVGTLSATDPDGGTVIFSIPDATVPFAISGNSLIVAGVLDFETRASWPYNIQALASRGGSTLNAVIITVTDVSETPGGEQPPIPDPGDVEEDGNFTTPTTVTQVDAAIKIHGKKAPGSIGKFIVPLPDLEADSIVTIHWTLDASLMSLQGRKILAGFVLKQGNDFHMVGPQGDGTVSGVNLKTIYGDNKWNSQTGLTEVNDGAPANGSQYDMWFQIEVDSSGDKYTIRTATDPGEQADFDDEFTGRDSSPFALVVDAADFGFGALFQADDTGVYSFTLEFYAEGEPEFEGDLWTPVELGSSVVAWYDPSDAANVTESGGVVDNIDDLSANDWDIVALLTQRPVRETVADWGGLHGIKYDGSNDQLVVAEAIDPVVNQPLTICQIYRTPATIDDLDDCFEGVTLALSMKWSGVSNKPHAFAGSAVARSNTVLSTSTSYIDITLLSGASSYTRLNGNAADPTSFNPGTSGINGDFGFFARGGFSFFGGHRGESFIVNRALTQDEVEKIEGYYAHTWSRTADLPVTHSYKAAPPVITVSAKQHWRVEILDNNAVDNIAVILELHVHTGTGGFGTNAAFGKTITADTQFDVNAVPSNIIDTDISNANANLWASTDTAFPHYVAIDFGSPILPTAISIIGSSDATNLTRQPKDFRVQYSSDGSTWFTLWSEAGVTFAAYEYKRFVVPGASGGYTGSPHGAHTRWRLFSRRDNGGTAVSATKIEMRSTPGGADICSGGTPFESGHITTFVVANAFDADNSTFWTSNVDAQTHVYCGYTFASPVELAEFTWRIRQDSDANQSPRDILVQFSDDGTNWTTAWSVSNQTGWSLSETRTFTDPFYV